VSEELSLLRLFRARASSSEAQGCSKINNKLHYPLLFQQRRGNGEGYKNVNQNFNKKHLQK